MRGRDRSQLREVIGFILGVCLLAGILFCPPPGELGSGAWRTAAVAALMAVWWVTEAIPIAATALVPIALFPLLGIMDSRHVALIFLPIVWLFLVFVALPVGGRRIAGSMESISRELRGLGPMNRGEKYTCVVYFIGMKAFGIQPGVLPPWAG